MIMRNVAAILLAGLALAGCKTAPRTAEVPRNYLLFFRFDSADLSPDARRIVDQAAAGIKVLKPSTVGIAGFTDKVGTPGYNQHLAERRIAAVEAALTADGIDPKLFLTIPLGDSEPVVGGTGDRRVEIRLAAPPSS
ncbi:MAG TPA: OmpA family protein [Alphaproteobacteria bacterium]|nr:OmpA family protein [Alphaproteobacteria bacterium]